MVVCELFNGWVQVTNSYFILGLRLKAGPGSSTMGKHIPFNSLLNNSSNHMKLLLFRGEKLKGLVSAISYGLIRTSFFVFSLINYKSKSKQAKYICFLASKSALTFILSNL